MTVGSSNIVRYNVMPDGLGVAPGLYQAKYGLLVAYECYRQLRDAALEYLEDPCSATKDVLLLEIRRENEPARVA